MHNYTKVLLLITFLSLCTNTIAADKLTGKIEKNTIEKSIVKTKKKIPSNSTINKPSKKNTAPPRSQGQFHCRGPAKKWQMGKINSGPSKGMWSFHIWFDPAPSGTSNPNPSECIWYGTPSGFRNREADNNSGITFEYKLNLNENPIKWLTVNDNASTGIELNRYAFQSDRNLRFLYNHFLQGSSDAFIWAKRTNRKGTSREFGVIYEVANVDREHGFRFPQTPH